MKHIGTQDRKLRAVIKVEYRKRDEIIEIHQSISNLKYTKFVNGTGSNKINEQ
ncbi:hypothetical protein T4D_11434 [Trichinella pseudospiralis]|uniref:Uncharacterized protein n=1 Tax=Trichinella pseudospiralis TaxID=6337 RepID=A0A0V1DKF7_TRIPS|nr:hypothetical protein T4D_11434 [Trichinella pseudospiralis]